jgi:hypothetical protein
MKVGRESAGDIQFWFIAAFAIVFEFMVEEPFQLAGCTVWPATEALEQRAYSALTFCYSRIF